jgi:hypothetical protein
MRLLCVTLCLVLTMAAQAAGDGGSAFGSIKSDADAAKKQAAAWLKTTKGDVSKFEAIWKSGSTILEKATGTLVLGDPSLGKLLATAKDPNAPAPTELPKVLADKKADPFLRNTLALAYGKALVSRQVYEEGLEALLMVNAEESVDPATLHFHKAVCEYSLMMKDRADKSIEQLRDVSDCPDRYASVAALMHFDMQSWQEKDLGWIARKMDNIQRRLALKRGGKLTQKMQKEVLVRLDEMIKEMENRDGPGGLNGNRGNCPEGGPRIKDGDGGTEWVDGPQDDTKGGTANGKGEVNAKKFEEAVRNWGKMPEKDRADMLRDLTRDLPANERAVIERYFRGLQTSK